MGTDPSIHWRCSQSHGVPGGRPERGSDWPKVIQHNSLARPEGLPPQAPQAGGRGLIKEKEGEPCLPGREIPHVWRSRHRPGRRPLETPSPSFMTSSLGWAPAQCPGPGINTSWQGLRPLYLPAATPPGWPCPAAHWHPPTACLPLPGGELRQSRPRSPQREVSPKTFQGLRLVPPPGLSVGDKKQPLFKSRYFPRCLMGRNITWQTVGTP